MYLFEGRLLALTGADDHTGHLGGDVPPNTLRAMIGAGLAERAAPRTYRLTEDGWALRTQLLDMAALYRQGSSTLELAEQYGISPKTVTLRLEVMGVPLRLSGGGRKRSLSPQQESDVVAALAEGGDATHLGLVYGVHASTIRAAARRARNLAGPSK